LGHVLGHAGLAHDQSGHAVDAVLEPANESGLQIGVLGDQASKQALVGAGRVRFDLVAGRRGARADGGEYTEDRSLCLAGADGAGSRERGTSMTPFRTASIVTLRTICWSN
jgi:hypothetical protein